MADLLYNVSLAVVPRCFRLLSRTWFATCRVREHGVEHLRACQRAGGAIACFWHYGILFMFHHMRGNQALAMVSASRDGEYIARLARLEGFEPVRGSRGREGLRAVRAIADKVAEGRNGAIVGDGSQGPPRRLQAGVIIMAARSGAPILPMAWSARRYKAFGSWDRTVLPLPGSRIEFFYGEPVTVPRRGGQGGLEGQRRMVEQRLNRLYARAWAAQGQASHDGLDPLAPGREEGLSPGDVPGQTKS